jgi:hypothetical protein
LLFQFNDITRQKLGEHRLRVQATTDALTGLYNRRQFDRLLARQIAEAQRYGDKLGLLFIDVDRSRRSTTPTGIWSATRCFAPLPAALPEHPRNGRLRPDRWGRVLRPGQPHPLRGGHADPGPGHRPGR